MNDCLALARKDPQLTAAAAIAVIGALGIATVYVFQYVFLILPCPLCLEQRIAFYFSIPLASMLWLGAKYGASRKVLLLGFLAIMLAMLWNTGLVDLSRGRRMEMVGGPERLFRADQRIRQRARHHEPVAEPHQPNPLRRGGLAVFRDFACRL